MAIQFTTDITEATILEQNAPPGMVEVRLYVDHTPSQTELRQVMTRLEQNSIDVRDIRVSADSNGEFIGILYYKPMSVGISVLPWLAIIPLISTLATLGLIAFGIVRIEDLATNLGKFVLVVGGITIILAALLRDQLGSAANKYIEKKF